jgi:glycosyltransferase involved in cell wall biosynthesis
VDFDITIVIPFYEGHSTIQSLLNSIPIEFPVIIVDDLSEKIPDVKRKNLNIFRLLKKGYFSGAVNFGIRQCETDVLVLNQDVEFKSRKAFDLILRNKEQYALIGESITGTHPAWPKLYVHGTFMFMRRDAIAEVGLLNEEHYPLWGSTCEWQLRACRKGYKALPTTIPDMIHKRKGSYGSSIQKLLDKNLVKKGLFIRTPPLVSVIVPAYNHAQYLPDLINSLIGGPTSLGEMPGQTFQAFDVIIADDCSTDGTEEVMMDLADPWKGIRYVKTPSNSGTSVACNLAIRNSYAKYIARIDADDMREAGSLEAMLEVQLQNPNSFVYDNVHLFTSKGYAKEWKMQEYDFDNLIDKNFIPAGIMFPKEAWEQVGGYPKEMRHGRDDWAFNVGLGLKGWCGVHLDRVGYLYRRHDNNRTTRNTTPAHRADFKRQIMSLFPEAYAQERPMACCGGGRPRVQSQTYQANKAGGGIMAAGMPGASGLVLVEYQGKNFGNQSYYGPATGSVYTFNAKKNKKWVDRSDLNFETRGGQRMGLLDLMDGGKALFKIARQPVAEKIAEATVIAIAEAEKPEIEIVMAVPGEVVEDTTKMIVEVADDYFVFVKGIGAATSAKMVEKGYYSAEQILNADDEDLKEEFGWSDDKIVSIREQLIDAS